MKIISTLLFSLCLFSASAQQTRLQKIFEQKNELLTYVYEGDQLKLKELNYEAFQYSDTLDYCTWARLYYTEDTIFIESKILLIRVSPNSKEELSFALQKINEYIFGFDVIISGVEKKYLVSIEGEILGTYENKFSKFSSPEAEKEAQEYLRLFLSHSEE